MPEPDVKPENNSVQCVNELPDGTFADHLRLLSMHVEPRRRTQIMVRDTKTYVMLAYNTAEPEMTAFNSFRLHHGGEATMTAEATPPQNSQRHR